MYSCTLNLILLNLQWHSLKKKKYVNSIVMAIRSKCFLDTAFWLILNSKKFWYMLWHLILYENPLTEQCEWLFFGSISIAPSPSDTMNIGACLYPRERRNTFHTWTNIEDRRLKFTGYLDSIITPLGIKFQYKILYMKKVIRENT